MTTVSFIWQVNQKEKNIYNFMFAYDKGNKRERYVVVIKEITVNSMNMQHNKSK